MAHNFWWKHSLCWTSLRSKLLITRNMTPGPLPLFMLQWFVNSLKKALSKGDWGLSLIGFSFLYYMYIIFILFLDKYICKFQPSTILKSPYKSITEKEKLIWFNINPILSWIDKRCLCTIIIFRIGENLHLDYLLTVSHCRWGLWCLNYFTPLLCQVKHT